MFYGQEERNGKEKEGSGRGNKGEKEAKRVLLRRKKERMMGKMRLRRVIKKDEREMGRILLSCSLCETLTKTKKTQRSPHNSVRKMFSLES